MIGTATATAPQSRTRWLGVAALVLVGWLLGLLVVAQWPQYTGALQTARSYEAAVRCSSGPACVVPAAVTVSNRYVTYGSKGAQYYHVDFAVPGGAVQETLVSYGVYLALPPGTTVPAMVWQGRAVSLQLGGIVVQTDAHPYGALAASMIGLFLLPIVVWALIAALLLAAFPRSPDDVLRDAVTPQSPPPRLRPPGLLSAVLAWRSPAAAVAGIPAAWAELIYAVIQAQQGPEAPAAAPVLSLLAGLLVGAVTYRLVYRRWVRIATEGVFAAIPVAAETIIRGRYGPIGVRVTYQRPDGQAAKVSVTRKWWRAVHPGTRLEAATDPVNGKVWRVLGMYADSGAEIH